MSENKLAKSSGAFREVEGYFNSESISGYVRCTACNGLYVTMHDKSYRMGLPNLSGSEALRRDSERQQKSRELLREFEKVSNRCRCDTEGDAPYVEKIAETNAWFALDWKAKMPPNAGEVIQQRIVPQVAPQTPSKPRSTKPGARNLADQLQQLSDLHSAGALSVEQYEAAKNKLLGL
jgi:hypothetical protein